MNFKKRKIGTRKERIPFKERIRAKSSFLTTAGIILVTLFFVFSFFNFLQNISLSSFFGIFSSFVGKDLKSDSHDQTNFLFAGTGDATHEGSDLTDSLIVASMDHEKKTVTLISIPRDMYVETENLGGMRINRVYEIAKKTYDSEQGLRILSQTISQIIDREIHYYVKMDFKGFEEIIDAMEGVDINVEKTIDDPFYPKEGTIDFAPFYLPKGYHRLDGKTALKYARSRKTTSDFDRSDRQRALLFAMRERAQELGLASSPSRIKNIFFSLEEHLETNMSIRELIALADLADDFPEENIRSYAIHDDFSRMGGFLYVPVREFYGGAFVLLPAGDNYDILHMFFGLILNHSELLAAETPLQILNGSALAGLASEMRISLKRLGLNVARYGNARSNEIVQTTVFYKTADKKPELADVLGELLDADVSPDVPKEYLEEAYQSEAEIIIEFGSDFAEKYKVFDVYDLIIQSVVAAQEAEAAAVEGAESANPASSETPVE